MRITRIARLTVTSLLITAQSIENTQAYVSSGLPPHVHHAWLQRMTSDIVRSPIGDLTPEMLRTTPQLISAWAQNPLQKKKTSKSSPHGKECALEVERLLKRLVDERRAGNDATAALCNTATYNCVLSGWAKSGEGGAAAQRAEHILTEMQEAFERGEEAVRPDTESFKFVIAAWANSGETNAPQRARSVLERMVALGGGDDETTTTRSTAPGYDSFAAPDAECFEIVLNCYARSGRAGAARRTEKTLLWMERLYKKTGHHPRLKPRTEHYNAVVTAWAWSDEIYAVDRACEILEHMELLHENDGDNNDDDGAGVYRGDDRASVRPDLTTYTSVIRACAKNGCGSNARRAEDVLDRLEEKYRGGQKNLRPGTLVYNYAIDSWTKSNDDMAPYRAIKILERLIVMREDDGVKRAKPDACSYTSVISAAASTRKNTKKTEAFKIARRTYRGLQKSEYTRPTEVSYGVMLKACARLVPSTNKREKIIKDVFRECRDDGMVSSLVLTWLKNGVSSELYEELYPKGKIPDEWSCNVGKAFRTNGRGGTKKNQHR